MASIQETYQPMAEPDAQMTLYTNIKKMNNSFWETMTNIQNSKDGMSKAPRYYAAERLFSHSYAVYNKEYRELFHGTQNSSVGLFNKQFNKRSMLEQLTSVHADYQVVTVNKYHKLKYHYTILGEVLKEQMALMYAIYGNTLTKMQVDTSISKVMIEYFNAGDVDWVQAAEVVRQFLSSYDVQDMVFGSQFYGVKPEKNRPTNLKYKTKNTGTEYTIKMLLDQGMKKAEICRELNMPRRTLYNIIKRYNLDKPITL